jgi:hypothetical protein
MRAFLTVVLALLITAASASAPAFSADLSLDPGDDAPVGPLGDPAALIIRGASQVPAGEIRTAIGESLDLLAARQDDAPRGPWLDQLATAVQDGYHQTGFRDATVAASVVDTPDGARVLLAIHEGERTRCGALALVADATAAAVLRDAFTPGPDAADADIDSEPRPSDSDWQPGHGVDYRADTLPDLVVQARTALRRAGLAGAALTAAYVPGAAPGTVDLALTVTHAPTAVRLGGIVVNGIPPDQADRLRAWLALAPDAPADGPLAVAVARRLRDSGRYLALQVTWEDVTDFNLVPGKSIAELQDDWNRAMTTGGARTAARGRADLVITLTPCPDLPPPWVADRAWDTILAARATALARLSAGRAALVVDGDTATTRIRLTWSPRHGLALQAFPRAATAPPTATATLICSAAGFIGRTATAAWTMPTCGLSLDSTLASSGENDRHTTIGAHFAYDTRQHFRLRSTIDPTALGNTILYDGNPGTTIATTWDGDVLVVRQSGTSAASMTYRADPATGISGTWIGDDGRTTTFHLADLGLPAGRAADSASMAAMTATGARDATTPAAAWPDPALIQMETAFASATGARTDPPRAGDAANGTVTQSAARPSAQDPSAQDPSAQDDATVGDLLAFGEALGIPPLHQPLRTVLAPIPVAGLVRSWIDPAIADGYVPFNISNQRTLRSAPGAQYMIANLAVVFDHVAAGRLPESAWPRRLLRASALACIGEGQTAVASLRDLSAPHAVGPIAFLACASAARAAHIEPLAVAYAEAGLACCDADGLVDDVHALPTLAPELLTALAASADLLAQQEPDPARAATLRRYARSCAAAAAPPNASAAATGPAPVNAPADPAARLATLVRLGADLGLTDWVKARLTACEDSAATFW